MPGPAGARTAVDHGPDLRHLPGQPLIASAKACDQILATEPPPTAVDLRRIMNLAQVAQSHALSFFHLSSPDLLFGFDAEAGDATCSACWVRPAAGP
jgi:Ni,Fe-hydrogenase I large subunit